MNELVARYVHQVGRYLPPKQRAEIEAELQSQIQDQLDDRYTGAPSQGDVVSVLSELGHPRKVAASYSEAEYLVGPALYPTMIAVLRYGWLLLPTIVVFLSGFGVLIAPQPDAFVKTLLETLLAVLQAVLIFSGVVVLGFALLERSGIALQEQGVFNPLSLPQIDDPRSVERFAAAFGIAMSIVVLLMLVYFLSVGGLTLRFNLSDPGEVIPVPTMWLILLIFNLLAITMLHLVVLRRNRWSSGIWLLETILEVFGTICLYFVLFTPLFERLSLTNPALANMPEIITVCYAVATLASRGMKLVRIWNYHSSSSPFPIQTH